MTAWKNVRFACLTALLLGAYGCGDDDGGTPDTGMPDTGDMDGAMDDADTGMTITEIAAGNPDFSLLVEAAVRTGLDVTLGEDGQEFTVFAPTDQAFMDSGITDLSGFTDEQLTGILTYHALLGEVTSDAIAAGPATTVASLTLFLGTEGGVTINGGNAITGGANVVTPDIDASNGVIHIIDRVLLPPNIPQAATYGGLTGLLGAVGAASPLGDGTSVADALSNPDAEFTVFAPNNAAFDALEETPEPDALRDILLYHVVDVAVPAADVPAAANSLLENEWGNNVTLLFDTSSGVAVNGVAVSVADIFTTNGVVHVIDAILLPPNVVDMVGIAGLTSLGDAVGAAAALGDGTSVADALAAQTAYTVFAPTNDAFTRAPGDLAPDVLRDVLLLHVVNAETPVLSTGLPASAPSLLGQDLTIDAGGPTVTAPGGTTGDGPAAIGPVDINVTNGVVHVISEVLLPGS